MQLFTLLGLNFAGIKFCGFAFYGQIREFPRNLIPRKIGTAESAKLNPHEKFGKEA